MLFSIIAPVMHEQSFLITAPAHPHATWSALFLLAYVLIFLLSGEVKSIFSGSKFFLDVTIFAFPSIKTFSTIVAEEVPLAFADLTLTVTQ